MMRGSIFRTALVALAVAPLFASIGAAGETAKDSKPFLGAPEDQELRHERGALRGLTRMTAVRVATARHYRVVRMQWQLRAEERRGEWLYYAFDKGARLPFEGAYAEVQVTHRYKVRLPVDTPRQPRLSPEELPDWSEPVNGLRCRLYVAPHDPCPGESGHPSTADMLVLEIHNVTDQAITVPAYHGETPVLDIAIRDYPELRSVPAHHACFIMPYVIPPGETFAFRLTGATFGGYCIAYGRYDRDAKRGWVVFNPAGKTYRVWVVMARHEGEISVYDSAAQAHKKVKCWTGRLASNSVRTKLSARRGPHHDAAHWPARFPGELRALARQAIALRPKAGPVAKAEENATGLDLSPLVKLTGQQWSSSPASSGRPQRSSRRTIAASRAAPSASRSRGGSGRSAPCSTMATPT